MKKQGITAAGTWIADYTKTIAQFPKEGACTSVLSEEVNNGGAPYNILIDLCRMNAPFPLRGIGCVGKDIDGANILKDCRSHQIDASGIRLSAEKSTSFSDVMAVAKTGTRTSFNHAGANALLVAEDFDFQSDSSKIFMLGTLLFLAGLDASDKKYGTKAGAVLAAARKAGLLTSVDIERTQHVSPAEFTAACYAAIKHTDLLILNVEICEILTSIQIRNPVGVDFVAATEAAKLLAQIGQARFVVIRFPAGALALSDDGTVTIEGSVQVPQIRQVNAAGTGHAFTAGFLYGIHENLMVSDCLKSAHAVAAACLMDGTASGGIRTLKSCLGLLEKFGQRKIDNGQ